MKNDNFFSIDVDSHLKSVATHTFGSPSHYPVELVRAALKRGASQVHVHLGRNYIQVLDNGSGLSHQALEILSTILELNRPEALKEEAVEKLQELNEYGLLAIFSASPHKILVENVSSAGTISISYIKGILHRSLKGNLESGTRLTIHSKINRDLLQEKEILATYCKSVQRDIYLNKAPISKKPQFTNYLAAIKINSSRYSISGEVAIPRDGNTCTIKLLDMGIPYRYLKIPPQKGYIFNAAIEYGGEVTFIKIVNILTDYCFTLYKWLSNHHGGVSTMIQERIEELIFTQYRTTGETALIKDFSPFKIFRSKTTLTLPSVIQAAEGKPIQAIPRNKEHLKYNIGFKRVLSLTQDQADLLINLQNIPVTFLSPVEKRRDYFKMLTSFLKRTTKSIMLFLFPSPSKGKILMDEQMTQQEKLFTRILNRYLEVIKPQLDANRAVLVSSRGPFPAVLSRTRKNTGRTLFVRRNNSLVQKAIKLVSQDPRNIEIVMPIFLD